MEEWKPVIGYEGLYEISNKAILRKIYDGRWLKIKKEGQLILGVIDKVGRNIVRISKNKSILSTNISRIVAKAFIPNPLNLPLVCHKDETLDENGALYNGVDNLFWGTYSDNLKDCYDKGRKNSNFHTKHPFKGKFGKLNPKSKTILQYELNGTFIKKWYSLGEIYRKLGFNRQNISACCNGRQKTAYGYIWKNNEISVKGDLIKN